jgi:hypothetical protein
MDKKDGKKEKRSTKKISRRGERSFNLYTLVPVFVWHAPVFLVNNSFE